MRSINNLHINKLRPYQREVALAILNSVFGKQGLTFSVEKAKSQYRPSQTMNFYVDPAQGHDDFLMSLALLAEAAKQYSPRGARGSIAK